MSLPSFPDKNKVPNREEAINQIISSIAMEEVGLSHVINAEGEKLQYAMGTIPGISGPAQPLSVDDLLKLNKSVSETLDSTMLNQFFLKEKLQNALSADVMRGATGATGPQGPQGPATIDIFPEVRCLEPDEAPTVENIGPSPQEAVLVFGLPRGYTGATGAAGATISDTYDDYDTFIQEHATGTQGEAYLVECCLYVWHDDDQLWHNMGSLIGPTGPQGETGERGPTGAAGATILDAYDDYDTFIQEHTTGTQGDAYLVENCLYVWHDDDQSWHDMGSLTGATGAQGEPGERGATGSFDLTQALFTVGGATGANVPVLFSDTLTVQSESLDVTVETGPAFRIEQPYSAGAIIPFSTGDAIAMMTSIAGAPYRKFILGRGNTVYLETSNAEINIGGSHDLTLPMPAKGTLNNISMFFHLTANSALIPDGDTIITVQLFASTDPTSDVFIIVPGAAVSVSVPFHAPPGGTYINIESELDIELAEQSRIMLVAYANTAPWYEASSTISGRISAGIQIY